MFISSIYFSHLENLIYYVPSIGGRAAEHSVAFPASRTYTYLYSSYQAASLPHASAHRPCRVLSLQLFQGQRLWAWGRVCMMEWGTQREQEESEEGCGIAFMPVTRSSPMWLRDSPSLWPSAVAREAREHQGDWGIWVPADLGIYPPLILVLPPAGGVQQPWVSQEMLTEVDKLPLRLLQWNQVVASVPSVWLCDLQAALLSYLIIYKMEHRIW